jgi:hypothetical protein
VFILLQERADGELLADLNVQVDDNEKHCIPIHTWCYYLHIPDYGKTIGLRGYFFSRDRQAAMQEANDN